LEKQKALRIVVAAAVCAAGSILIEQHRAPAVAAAYHADAALQQAAGQPPTDPGAKSYLDHCAMCHGAQRQGNPPQIPSLVGVGKRLTDEQITDMIHNGKSPMPPFPDIKGDELKALLKFLTGGEPSTKPTTETNPEAADESEQAEMAGPPQQPGRAIFQQNCSFCHGRDAMGGETGPDLTRSKLVTGDKTGDQILTVVREGRPGNKMPAFNFSSQQLQDLLAFIRARVAEVAAHPGGRRGVDVSDLQTGNLDAGKAYFNGAGGCAKCHSPTGDLAGIANRYEGLRLEERMLYPWNTKSAVTVTLPSGETISGTLAYLDEFTVALRDASGTYRSWSTSRVRYKVDAPVNAHVDQFPKYTDDDIHNLMAYLQSLH
jgi:cytochrome c oxidase cbb3-type subunit III